MLLLYALIVGAAYALMALAYVAFWCIVAMALGAWGALEIIAELCVRCYRGYNKLYPKDGVKIYEVAPKPKWPGPPPPNMARPSMADYRGDVGDTRVVPPPGVPRHKLGQRTNDEVQV